MRPTIGNLNVKDTMAKWLNCPSNVMYQHVHNNPGHSINQNVEVVKSFRNEWDVKHLEWILSDIESLASSARLDY